MAKGKRSVALFDVLSKDKRYAQKSPTFPTTSKYTLKPNPKTPSGPTGDDDFSENTPRTAKPAGPPISALIRQQWEKLSARIQPTLLPIKQWIIRQNAVLAGAATAFALIGIVALVRHHSHSAAANHDLAMLDRIRSQPANPSVLQIASNNTNRPAAETAPIPTDDARTAGDTHAPDPANPTRQINLNYVLIQSYPTPKLAQQACDFLNQNGIPCTIERNVRNWSSSYYLVIGLKGFPRARGPEYEAYRDQILDLNAKFAPSVHNFKRFEPMAIKWDRPN